MKIKVILMSLALVAMAAIVFAGCTGTTPTPTTPPVTTAPIATDPVVTDPAATTPAATDPAVSPTTAVDVVSTASITDDPDVFKKAISKDGTWIICLTDNMVFTTDELVLEGEFKNGKKDDKGNDIIQRKIALYTQDENRVVTNRFTLTAPKLTINSPNASIQHGTFVGDLYVIAENFQLVDNMVDGDIFFATDKAKSTFKMDEKSSVTGVQEVKK